MKNKFPIKEFITANILSLIAIIIMNLYLLKVEPYIIIIIFSIGLLISMVIFLKKKYSLINVYLMPSSFCIVAISLYGMLISNTITISHIVLIVSALMTSIYINYRSAKKVKK